jgi:hypothetical protein
MFKKKTAFPGGDQRWGGFPVVGGRQAALMERAGKAWEAILGIKLAKPLEKTEKCPLSLWTRFAPSFM